MNNDAMNLAEHRARLYRESAPAFAAWASGYGAIRHSAQTQLRIFELAQLLVAQRKAESPAEVYGLLAAADRVASAAMWLTVHMTYAGTVKWDGSALAPSDYKETPEGHTGGSLNMVPAYVGYLAANSLTGHTRGWVMGQGHSVAGIEAVNLLVGNTLPVQAARYDLSEAGLGRFVNDFYSYAIGPDGRPATPLGSHVNANTAGGISEGGYLGFAELQYVHMPLPGERLVAFLSDGAFEEQRGSDWAPRWWRAEDSGHVAPIMILNGRRIEQRSTMQQQGGVQWRRDVAVNFDVDRSDGDRRHGSRGIRLGDLHHGRPPGCMHRSDTPGPGQISRATALHDCRSPQGVRLPRRGFERRPQPATGRKSTHRRSRQGAVRIGSQGALGFTG